MFKRAIAVVTASMLTAASLSAQVTVGVIGNGANGTTYPFGSSGGYTQFQQVYASSYFTSPLDIGAISFYSKPGTQILQEGTYNLSFATTLVTPGNFNTGNPSANGAMGTQFFAQYIIGANVDAPDVLTIDGVTFHYDPMVGNLLLNIGFTPIGSIFASNRAAFDQIYDPQGTAPANYTVATSSDVQAFFGVTAGTRGSGLVTTFAPAAVVATPEPATVWLLTTGLAGIGFIARRRRNA